MFSNKINNGKKLTQEIAIERIEKRCKENNITFLGFNNETKSYENDKTLLILQCNNCQHIWNTTQYCKFVRNGRKCPNCNKYNKNKPIDVESEILNACKDKNFTFLGFNTIDKQYHTKNDYLILQCNSCGIIWNDTRCKDLLISNKKHHTCGRKKPTIKHKHTQDRKIERIQKMLKNTTLEVIELNNNTITFKCILCSSIFTYSYTTFISNKGDIHCKICDRHDRFNQEKAIEVIIKQCKKSDFTFLGFNTNNGLYQGKNTQLILQCNKCKRIWKTTRFCFLKDKIMVCKDCHTHYRMEKEIEIFLQENNYEVERGKTFDWLKYKSNLFLDVYIPKLNIAIECQGIQHFEPRDFCSKLTEEKSLEIFKQQLERDKTKLKLCKEHNLKLLYFSDEVKYKEFLSEKLIKNKNELLKIIKQYEEN